MLKHPYIHAWLDVRSVKNETTWFVTTLIADSQKRHMPPKVFAVPATFSQTVIPTR